MKCITSFIVFLIFVCFTSIAYAIPTTITVKVISKGAKFVGSSMGGVQIVLRNKSTGEILAQGITKGGTGKTGRIMKKPRKSGKPLSDDSAAQFTVVIDIDEPIQVEVTAIGPLAQLQAQNTVTSTQWVVPGKHIDTGDAWLLELPGFAVDITSPPSAVKFTDGAAEVAIKATITMMCGCPIIPSGLWDSEKFEITALLKKDSKKIGEFALAYAGSPSQFEAVLPVKGPGVYEVCVYAFDPANGNTGIDKATFVVK